jgi:hypothetical protein
MRGVRLLPLSLLLVVMPLAAAELPNYDALSLAAPGAPETARIRLSAALTNGAFRVQWESRLGVPTFLWATATTTSFASAKGAVNETAEVAARRHLAAYAPLYGLSVTDVSDAYVAGLHDTGRGAVVVKLRQKVGGIEVFRDEVNVIMTRSRDLMAISGYLTGVAQANLPAFAVLPKQAVNLAYADMFGSDAPAGRRLHPANDGYDLYAVGDLSPVRVKRIYFHLPDRLEPAYSLELDATNAAYSYVISAVDGRLLFRNNLIAEESTPFAYRVWAHAEGDHIPYPGPQGTVGSPNPTGTNDGFQPPFIQPNLITLGNGPISTGDPWLPPDAKETVGNNVDAYLDLNPPDGFSPGDFRASVLPDRTFDRLYDVTAGPDANKTQQMAAVVQLFYDVNFLHDWFYDAGFNEAAGNAQTNNYGRGGISGDNLRAEAHDYSGRNNANMFTPADGGRPRMQMYIFDGIGRRTLQIDSPQSAAKEYATAVAEFGSQSFELSGDIVPATPADACAALSTALTGKIALIDRGGCSFSTKVSNAQDAGAIAVIMANTADSPGRESLTTMACSNSPCSSTEISLIPALLVAFSDAEALRAGMGQAMHASMRRDRAIDRDGAIDNQVVAHEWCHYLSNRLIGNGNGLSNIQSRGLGEGWSDFNALLLTVRPEDVQVPSNATFDGAYVVGEYITGGGSNGPRPNGGSYFGIRRVPYSTDIKRDPLTLRHVGNGVPISGVPTSFGADGTNNSEIHNTGEIWTTMLWECYASLLRDTLGTTPRLTFGEAQQRMKEYLVASLRATPVNPTILEARDALLAVAFARDKTDYQEFWQAFAKRGAGVNAVAPERFSTANLGATEDFSLGGAMTVDAVALDDSVESCQSNGLLDGGETGALTIRLRNSGSQRLEATSIRVSTADARLTFSNSGTATVPATNPGETVSVALNASLAKTTGIVKPDINITVSDPAIALIDGVKSVYFARLNASEDPEQSATDDVESRTSAWTATSVGPLIWSRLELTPRDHRWIASEPAMVTDQYLVSPAVVVAPTGTFSITFRHRYAFDFSLGSSTSYIDGGVVEISTDDGLTWNDVGGNASPGYGTTPILTANGSPIEGRLAFEGTSPGFSFESPSASPLVTTTINLGTDYAGRRIRFRFRLATAAGHSGAPRLGWEIDDIAFNNIVTLPFYAISGSRGLCGVNASATTLRTSVATASVGSPIMLIATVRSAMTPMGTVDFLDNGALIGSARIENGVALFTTSSLPAGAHSLTAAFAGSTNFSSSRSTAVAVAVAAPRHRPAGR